MKNLIGEDSLKKMILSEDFFWKDFNIVADKV